MRIRFVREDEWAIYQIMFLIKGIRLAKDEIPLFVLDEPRQITSFIR